MNTPPPPPPPPVDCPLHPLCGTAMARSPIFSWHYNVSLLPACRLDQLLPYSSLVIKEESGYRGFYHHLMKPYEHYVPL